jgi:hypothetical protein
MRRGLTAGVGFAIGAGFYLLLIDTTSLPELYVLLGVALLAGIAFQVSQDQGLAEAAIKLRWLSGVWRVLVRVPAQIALVSGDAIAQLFTRRPARGEFRAVPFRGGEGAGNYGRCALTESLGSFAPNTIVIGVDPERNQLLVHQLHPQGGRDEIDVLRLG